MSWREEWQRHRSSPERHGFLERLRPHSSETISIGVFSSTTWRPLVPFLEGELLVEGVRPRIACFEYGALDGEIAGGDARFETVVLALDDRESYGPLYSSDEEFDEESASDLCDLLLARVDRLTERTPHVIVTTPPSPDLAPPGANRTVEGVTLTSRVQTFVSRWIRELEARDGVEIFDLELALAPLGAERALDPRLWHLGRIRYTESGWQRLGIELAPRLFARLGRGIKAVIVDLDNTLWGGVVGEDGPHGIELGTGYPGECFRDLQRELLRWKRAGILLAVASKNNAPEALEILDEHPEMVLRRSDFDHLEIHWEPKTHSVARILDAFNIGQEAVLFIDDNPRERNDVADAFPRLRVLDLPAEPLHYASRLRSIPWPLFAVSSTEDRRRSELQAQQRERRSARETARSRADFLESLGIEVEIAIDCLADVKRVAQLHQKTNQFNVNPVRHTETEISVAMKCPQRKVFTLRYRDRFGEAGLVGCAVVHDTETGRLIETFLLSCRTIGLGVESALLAQVLEGELPVRWVYRVTEKNVPAREFLADFGELEPEGGELRIPTESVESPGWIRVQISRTEEPEHAS